MKDLILAEHLHFEYVREEEENILVLNDIDVSIHQGEFVAILGHNGSGKSTLAKHFNAVLLPTSGRVLVDGVDTADQEHLFDIRQKVGMVFQNPDNQIVATIVEEDVAFALENLGVEPEEIRRRVDEALKTVDMYEFKEHAPHQLSGGQKQRIAIAGVIAMRPECVVLDEPTAMLDPKGRKEIMAIIDELHREGITVVLITHFMEEAVRADRVMIMHEGKILLDGTPAEIFSQGALIKSVNMDVPPIVELADELRALGISVPDEIITEEEMVAYVCQYE